MVWPGSIPREIAKIHDIVKDAHDAAIRFVRPGVTANDVDNAARRVIEKAGYGASFDHATGHGIGLDVHEAPRVGKGTDIKLKPGMVITIEPGIYLPGKGGVRLEDDVLVTETGYEVLSTLPC
jgi:Xaa-Pro aminopeptidase